MALIRKFLFGSLAGLISLQPLAAAAAMPVTAPPAVAGDVTNVRLVCDDFGCRDVRPGYRPGGYDRRDYRRPPPRYPPVYRPPVYVSPPPVYVQPPPVYARPPVYAPAPRLGSRHVEWCLNRYRSYNPRTNQFLAYDGYYKDCRSPYR